MRMMPPLHTPSLRTLLALTLLLASVGTSLGCKGKPDPQPVEPPAEAKEDKEVWRKQSVALKVTGFSLNGGSAEEAGWVGSGVFVAPGIIATNAHVAARALRVEGRDDTNRPHVFDRIIAIDMVNDLALLKADYVNEDVTPATLIARPGEPKSLRQTKILAIGNSGGLGLSTYTGQITNVVEEGEFSRILHDAQIAGGSSGGPLFDAETFELIGVNHATNAQLNTSLAIPAWKVTEWLGSRGAAQGLPLQSAFAISAETGLLNAISRDVCLPPGQALDVPVTYSNGVDFAVTVVPKDAASPVIYGMGADTAQGRQYFDKGMLSGQVVRVFTTPIAAQYVLTVGAPPQATSPTCVQLVIGQIDWGKQINSK